MACERYREALTDLAAGAPAAASIEAHLASCEACRAELQGLRQALALADAAMADLRAAEPTPELAVRIRQAVAEAGEPSPRWRFGWLWPATAAAATLLVAWAVVMGRGTGPAAEPKVAVEVHRPQSADGTRAMEAGEPGATVARPVPGAGQPLSVPQRHRLSSRGASIESVDEGSAGVAAPPAPDSSPAPRSLSAGRRPIPAEPEVLVPPGETEALLGFVALVHRDRMAPAAFGAAGEPSAGIAELTAIDIQPLEIVPLDPAETSGT